MDLVDEQHIARLQVGQQPGQVGGFLDHRPAGGDQVDFHGGGEDVGERGFAKTGRTTEEDVIEGFAAKTGGFHGHPEPFLDLGLAGKLRKRAGAQGNIERLVMQGLGYESFLHDGKMMEPAGSRQDQKSARGRGHGVACRRVPLACLVRCSVAGLACHQPVQ